MTAAICKINMRHYDTTYVLVYCTGIKDAFIMLELITFTGVILLKF